VTEIKWADEELEFDEQELGDRADPDDLGDQDEQHDGPTMGSPRPRPALRFYTPAELAGLTHEEPEWVVQPGLLAIGAITEIDGKIKAAGKTTLALYIVRAVLDGTLFLGLPTRQARVVYVTEQSRATFTDALRRAGLVERRDELRILFREDIGRTPWADVVAACRQDGYDVVVFDTIGKLAGIREENSAGEWAVAMTPLQDLAASGRAVLIARHDRKGGGDVGDSGRGSSQASGDVDVILAIRRPEGNQPGNRRVVESLSRYAETPEKIVVELTPSGYVLLGSAEAVATTDARAFVVWCLGSEFHHTTSEGLTRKDLEQLGQEREPKVKSWAIRIALDALLAAGTVAKTGEGKAGDPYVYTLGTSHLWSGETQTSSTTTQHFDLDDDYAADLLAEAQRVYADDLDPEAS
jgi:hypothetical protein